MLERPAGVVGTSVPRREGRDKVRGTALYVDDLSRDGVWVGGVLRSTVACASGVVVRRDPTFDWSQVAVVTAAEITGENVVPLLIDDQPALAADRIRHADEPVALVAAPDRETLAAALAALAIECTKERPLLDLDESLAAAAPIFRADNLFKSIEIVRGDVAAALAGADLIVETETRFKSQAHVYIEPQGMQAEWGEAGVFLRGSLQCPYYVKKGIARLFGLKSSQIRVRADTVGGGFGGKEEYPSMMAAHAALLARAAGRPVRIVPSRIEDMRSTPKRHPGRVRARAGLMRDGRIVGIEIDLVLDGGAYCTLSPVVLSRAAIHAAGCYDIPHARVRARAVATNHPPFGAFRGFGAPQSILAVENLIEECAAQLGIDPIDVRRRNLVRPGGRLVTSQEVGVDAHAEAVLDEALLAARYHERRRENDAFNIAAAQAAPGDARRGRRRGIGLSLFHHGSGFTGSGEMHLHSRAGIRVEADGTFSVLSAQTEIGQGTLTILAQAAAEGLGVPVELVRTIDPDTDAMPDSGPTVASRTGMVVGGLLHRAGQRLRALALECTGNEDPRGLAAHAPIEAFMEYEAPAGMKWDEERYIGDAYAAYSWGAQVVALEVDLDTCEVPVLDATAVQEVGRVMNPILAAGQIEGGVAQGLGWALIENLVWSEGRVANPALADYVIPTAMDAPPIAVVFLERGNPRSPQGVKGIGELPMDGPAPATLAALRQALGIALYEVPATPERIFAALSARLHDETTK